MPQRGGWRLARRGINIALATVASAAVLTVCGAGFGSVPALGPVLVPGHGAWTSAIGAQLPRSQRLVVPGLGRPAAISYSPAGLATVNAASVPDAALALGYAHAAFRLTQMDLARRLGEGRLAQLVGPSAVRSDEFELRLGLLRTAQAEWAAMPKSSLAARVLISYARGVNDYLAQLRADGNWPAVFSLTGVYPANWTPVDSLAVQGDLTQELDFTTTPLDYALLVRSLGMARTMAWFPILPLNQQRPYDPGPYRWRGVAPLEGATSATLAQGSGGAQFSANTLVSRSVARAVASVLAVTSALPAGQLHGWPDSNAWAANGPAVAGRSMLAGDPHLPQTLPSVWFAVAMTAPGLDVTGVSVPGLPGVLIGHNRHIAWSLTDTQNQSALFYIERTSASRPGQYFWNGRWLAMRRLRYLIPVRGQAPRWLTVWTTIHGPVLTKAGQTVSVDWMGSVPSPDVAALLGISTAANFAQFKAALAGWRAPTQNFVYADDRGNIGAISAGYYPIVSRGDPWLPLSGTGAEDVIGVIPYAAVPQAYDPPGHVIATANQRPVGPTYPYYIGTTANAFDPGYRASREYDFLDRRSAMTTGSFAALQSDLSDELAVRIVPKLLAALRGARLTATQRAAAGLLAIWNRTMDPTSAAAAIWWRFWANYLADVFGPWWSYANVPVHLDRPGLAVSPSQFSLDQVLEHWTLAEPGNPAFSPPGAGLRSAPQVMRTAFAQAVAQLEAKLGGGPSGWAWGRMHSRQFPSLTGIKALGYGPLPAGGDSWTVDAAGGLPISRQGPSWRQIVRFAGPGKAVAVGVYPGGQSENPASPWYANLVNLWWNGQYLPLPPAGALASGPVVWVLAP